MRRLPLRLLALAAAAGSAGCVTVLPKSPPVQLYRFGAAPVAATAAQTRIAGRGGAMLGVVLSEVSLPRAAMGDGLLTVTGDQAAYVAGARWMSPAASLFQDDAEAAFAARAPHLVLLGRGQIGAAAALLSLDVTRFETRYPPGGGAPVVAIGVHAALSRPDGAAVATRTFAVQQPAGEDRVSAIVAAYDQAADTVLAQVVDWTDATVPGLVSPASSPAPP